MTDYIKTFYLWLGLFTSCNAVTLFALHSRPAAPAGGAGAILLAWLLQLPMAALLAGAHHGLNRLLSLLPVKWKIPLHFLLCALCTFLFMGMYAASQLMYQQLESFISWDAFRAALTNAAQLAPQIIGEMGTELLLIGVLSVVISLFYTRRYHRRPHTHSPLVFWLLCLVFITSSAGGFAVVNQMDPQEAAQIRRRLLPTTYLTFSILDRLLPTASPAADFLKDLVFEKQVAMEDYFRAQQPPDGKPHIFFIMLESVSWDHYGFTGYAREGITPNLDRLAAESVVFTRAYTPACHSNYAQTSTHASQYPLRRKQLDQFENVNYPKTLLMDILSYAGYRTAFFSAQNEDWQGMKSFIQAHTQLQQFYHSKTELGDDIGPEAKVDDAVVRRRAVEFLDAHDAAEPIFMYINLQATHFPYTIPDPAARLYEPCGTDDFEYAFFSYDPAHLQTVINKYDNALHYVDAQVGAFLQALKERGLYENSLIVAASDHGEAFYEHGYPTHGTSLFEDQVRTAVLFKLPANMPPAAGVRTDPVSLIDINPTILEILGMPNHPNFQGQPVLGNKRTAPVYLVSHGVIKAHAVVDYPWKYMASERDGEQLLHLGRDSGERVNCAAEYPDIFTRLKEELRLYQLRQLYYYTVLPQEERDRLYPPRH